MTLLVKAVGEGEATITVTAAGKTATLTVYVATPTAIQGVEANGAAKRASGLYSLGGQYVAPTAHAATLPKGIYVAVGQDGKATKIAVK